MQRELETALAKGLLRADFGEDDTVVVEAPGGAKAKHLVIKREGSSSRKPIVDDSLDIDVTRDSVEEGNTNGAGRQDVAGARF